MSNRVGLNPFEVNDLVPRMQTGTLIEHKVSADLGVGMFRYVRFLDAVTYARGQVTYICARATGIPWRVTNDHTGGSSLAAAAVTAAGICCNIMTQNYYGFIQVSGIALVIGDGSVAAADFVVPDGAGTNGLADTMADGEEEQVFGVALSTDDTANDPLATSAMFYCQLKGLV